MKCIYYIDRTNLTESEEHIIPAGLGGIKTLPNNFVSREFNNDISKLEGKLMRDSFFSVPRQFDGPGKRGSNAEQHATKSKVLVLKNDYNTVFALGYIKLGVVYQIPTISIDTDNEQISARTNEIDKSTIHRYILNLKEQFSELDKFKMKLVEDDQVPTNIILLGCSSKVEDNFDLFIFRHPENDFNLDKVVLKKVIEKLGSNEDYSKSEIKKWNTTQKFSLESGDMQNHLRVYAKIAFNFLANSIGADAIRDSKFDSIRRFITTGINAHLASWDFQNKDAFQIPNILLPAICHSILIFKHNSQLWARVAISSLPAEILLTDIFPDTMIAHGFICDFKNRVEYTAGEYIEKFKN